MSPAAERALWEKLAAAGLAAGDMPERREVQTPWYVRVMLGIAGVAYAGGAAFAIALQNVGFGFLAPGLIAGVMAGLWLQEARLAKAHSRVTPIAYGLTLAVIEIAREAHAALRDAPGSSNGRIVATIGADGVAKYSRLDDGRPLAADEIVLRYRVRAGDMKLGTSAWFFEEGTAKRYEPARYGEFRVDANGELLLTRMRGKDLQPL